MSLSPMQEEFLRNFFNRQREIGKQAMETTKLLARTNIESILWAGIYSDPSQEKMEEVLQALKAEREKRANESLDDILALQQRKKELENGDEV